MAQELTTELENLDSVKRRMAVTVPAEEVDREFAKAFRDVQKGASLPGFRKGHVPMQMVRRMYAEEVRQEVARELVSRAWVEGVKRTGARPVSDPDIKDLSLSEGQPLSFKAEFEVRPEVKLPAYKGLKLVKEVEDVSDGDVTRVLEDLRRKVAPIRDPAEERPVRRGDIAVIDFEGFTEGQPLPGAKAEGYPLEIGSGALIPGFEEALEGTRPGEQKSLVLTLPEDYPEGLGGRDAQFVVTVKAIKERVLPELDDDFAKDAGKYGSLDELKAKVRDQITSVRDREARARVKQQVVETLVAAADFVVPPSMLQTEESSILRDYARRLAIRGLPAEQARAQLEAARADVTDVARKNVKVALILDEVAAAEGLKVEKEDLDRALKETADRYRKPVAELRKEMIKGGAMESFAQVILEEKTLDFLLDSAEISEKKTAPAKGKGGKK